MKKTIWIAREFDDNSDACFETFDKEKAISEAEYMLRLLTKRERERTSVAVEGYDVEVQDNDTRSAKDIFFDMIDDACDGIDPDHYIDIKELKDKELKDKETEEQDEEEQDED